MSRYVEERPWGKFEVLERADHYQIKRITVNPGHRLSLQYHHHRTEHWVIVAGSGRVTRGEEVIPVVANQSVVIPKGAPHRIENTGTEPLVFIEVQYGEYLGEDDIVRLADDYHRVPVAPAPEGASEGAS
ncbi:Mannose-1-phosphate guanylyltransferase 1 [bacterium HR10]|nr:Mannose-1-phosphate guanylyltransferase 1 [bacterium HR10]